MASRGRVRYLGEKLLEIIEQQLVLVRQNRKRRIVPHRADCFVTRFGHGGSQHPQLFNTIAKGALHSPQFASVYWRLRSSRRQCLKANLVFSQPLTVGPAVRQPLLQFLVADDAALLEADQ